MIQAIKLVMFLFTSIIGVILLNKSMKESRKIFGGVETSPRKIVINSLNIGFSMFFIFLALLQLGGLIDQSFRWDIQGILLSLLISLGLGIMCFLGSCLAYFVAGKYRSFLHHKIEKYITKKEN